MGLRRGGREKGNQTSKRKDVSQMASERGRIIGGVRKSGEGVRDGRNVFEPKLELNTARVIGATAVIRESTAASSRIRVTGDELLSIKEEIERGEKCPVERGGTNYERGCSRLKLRA